MRFRPVCKRAENSCLEWVAIFCFLRTAGVANRRDVGSRNAWCSRGALFERLIIAGEAMAETGDGCRKTKRDPSPAAAGSERRRGAFTAKRGRRKERPKVSNTKWLLDCFEPGGFFGSASFVPDRNLLTGAAGAVMCAREIQRRTGLLACGGGPCLRSRRAWPCGGQA